MNCTTNIISKIITPTIMSLPITKLPNASITCPAYPLESISLVDDILSAIRKMVVMSKSYGNIENSNGSLTYKLMSNIISAKAILKDSNMSSKKEGNGNIISNATATTTIAIAISANFIYSSPS